MTQLTFYLAAARVCMCVWVHPESPCFPRFSNANRVGVVGEAVECGAWVLGALRRGCHFTQIQGHHYYCRSKQLNSERPPPSPTPALERYIFLI